MKNNVISEFMVQTEYQVGDQGYDLDSTNLLQHKKTLENQLSMCVFFENAVLADEGVFHKD